MTIHGADTDPADNAWELTGLDPSLAKDWHVWSVVLGRAIMPALDRVQARLPRLVSAMACTADGFNLCAVNTTESQVTRMAALTSSLFALASAHGEVIHGPDSPPATLLATENGNLRTVIVGRPQEMIGHALVQIVAADTTLGQLLVVAHSAVNEICDLLDLDPS